MLFCFVRLLFKSQTRILVLATSSTESGRNLGWFQAQIRFNSLKTIFPKFVRANLLSTYTNQSSIQQYIKHKVEPLLLAFPNLDEPTLITIATTTLPDKFDSQLQERVSMGMRHLNTMAHVIDKTLGFESSDDKDV